MSMKRLQPVSQHARIIWLETALRESRRDADAGVHWLSGQIRNQLESQLNRYQTLVSQSTHLFKARRIAVAAHEVAQEDLVKHVRMAYHTLRGMAAGGFIPSGQMNQFKLPTDKYFPQPGSYGGWIQAARVLVQGNATSVAEGFPAIPFPTPEVLQAKLDAATVAYEAVAEAKAAVNINIQEREAENIQIILLWQSIGRKLNDALALLPSVKRRVEMRRYGFVYKGTPSDEDGVGSTANDGDSGTSTTDGGDNPNGTGHEDAGDGTSGTNGSNKGQETGDASDQGDAGSMGQTTQTASPGVTV